MTTLRAGGVDKDRAEEAVAEAFARALARRLVVADVNEFCRWAFVVARNTLVDSERRNRRVVFLDVMPDAPDGYDLAGHVETKDRLERATALIASMATADRQALLASGDAAAPSTRKEAVGIAVRRHRVRARLRHSLGSAVGWVGERKMRWAGRMSSLSAESWPAMFAVPALLSAGWFTPSSAAPAEPPPIVQAAPSVASAPVRTATSPHVAEAKAPAGVQKKAEEGRTGSGGGGGPRRPAPSPLPIAPSIARTGVSLDAPSGDYVRLNAGVRFDPNEKSEHVSAVESAAGSAGSGGSAGPGQAQVGPPPASP